MPISSRPVRRATKPPFELHYCVTNLYSTCVSHTQSRTPLGQKRTLPSLIAGGCVQYISASLCRSTFTCVGVYISSSKSGLTTASDPGINGRCRFMDGTHRAPVALASFPGSGNTWMRQLLQEATGICTSMCKLKPPM